MFIAFLIQCVFYLFLFIILFLTVTIIGLKIWLEPKKGYCKCKVNLKGKVVLITGGNAGIGMETAKDLARREATVIIASRDVKKSEEVVKDIIKTTGNSNVHYRRLDLAKFTSIKEFAADFNKTFDRLDILVNNAGCAGLRPKKSQDGIERVTQINYVGPFLLTELLMKKLEASKPSRIVIVSSFAHKFHNFDPDDIAGGRFIGKEFGTVGLFQIYASTKLCHILWARALAKRLPDGVTANVLHPGVVKTEIYVRLPELFQKFLLFVIGSFFKNAKEGAQTTIHLCVAPELENVTGEYFSDCKIAPALNITKDEDLVEKVWTNTVSLIKSC